MLAARLKSSSDADAGIMQISLNELITALAAAFDLAENSDRHHSLRTAYLAARLATSLQMPEREVENIYFASLLHDLIPLGSSFDQRLIFDILKHLPLMPQVAVQVSRLWKYKRAHQLHRSYPEKLALEPRLIYLAEYFEDVYCSSPQNEHLLRRTLFSWVDRTVRPFEPKLAGAFYDCMNEEAFWQDIKESRLSHAIQQIAPDTRRQLDIDAIEKVSQSFSLLIDRKNAYTGQHSERVAMICGALARLNGMQAGLVRRISIAGYLHDLGKLSVPEDILNKPTSLSEEERQIIQAHPYDSYAVLSKIEGFADIARWAGNHHERMDGSGYPWGRRDLTIEDQIVAVADIYEALTANRPYRRALGTADALSLIARQVKRGEIMSEAYGLLQVAVEENRIH